MTMLWLKHIVQVSASSMPDSDGQIYSPRSFFRPPILVYMEAGS